MWSLLLVCVLTYYTLKDEYIFFHILTTQYSVIFWCISYYRSRFNVMVRNASENSRVFILWMFLVTQVFFPSLLDFQVYCFNCFCRYSYLNITADFNVWKPRHECRSTDHLSKKYILKSTWYVKLKFHRTHYKCPIFIL